MLLFLPVIIFFGSISSDLAAEIVEVPTRTSFEYNWNHLADVALDVVRQQLVKRGLDNVTIPDISVDFALKVSFVPVRGHIMAHNGWLYNLASIQRTGDVKVTQSLNVFTLECSMGLALINLGYEKYEVKIRYVGPRPKGRINGSVGSNSIAVQISLEITPDNCFATLKELKVLDLKDLNMNISGFGIFNKIISKKINEEIKKYLSVIVKNMEAILTNEIGRVLEKIQCSQFVGCLTEQARVLLI